MLNASWVRLNTQSEVKCITVYPSISGEASRRALTTLPRDSSVVTSLYNSCMTSSERTCSPVGSVADVPGRAEYIQRRQSHDPNTDEDTCMEGQGRYHCM